MAWVRAVCGRLKSDYRYSKDIVYNNFPWPVDGTDAQTVEIERLAQAVLDARELYPDSTLADLYDPLTMPPELTRAHQALDRAVDRLYRKKPFESDKDRLELLFKRYGELTS
ncbi:MAG: TTC39/IML2 family protein [Chloroflexota bacterium]|nr:TTC39/IML2 family protein [Chloroflexota bacterium]